KAIRELTAIKPGEATYIAAQYEICQLQYERLSKVKSDAAKAAPVVVDLLKSVERFLSLAISPSDGERRLKAGLLAVDALQATEKADAARMKSLLDGAAVVVERLAPENPSVVRYQCRRLELAYTAAHTATLLT